MASTYSNLKIQLMATGENSGTWGNVTNVNLGTALEEAIVGSADVSFSSAEVTLTLTDSNASQSARNLRLNLTGTSGGAQNLIVPAIEKVYIVNNGCADTITVKNTTGTGIAVPAGKTMYVYNNGTNVLDAVTHLTSLTLGSALPIASGGTGSTSTTYANLQSNVTGVLPAANGGTGLNAAGTTGNVLTSNGTAWTSVAAAGFPTGTVLIFAQTSAPTGWTKNTTTGDNSALRVVTGSIVGGGSVNFTTAFASQTPVGSVSIDTSGLSAGATTLNTAQIPSHSHSVNGKGFPFGDSGSTYIAVTDQTVSSGTPSTNSSGGGGSHSHSISGSATGTFTGTAINLAVKYVDVIRATKD
jgi:hypothetical protein